jgi:HAE1 family hydrophobic/amphiphilic exporter-1
VKLADVSVRNPVFAIMLAAALLLLGGFSYKYLGLDLMPKTDAAIVTVGVNLPGASAEEVETLLTKPIEEAVNTISGIDELRASSDQGNSRVTISFNLDRDIESATQDVRDRVASIRQVPRDATPPSIQKEDPDAQPILLLQVAAPRPEKELTQIADLQIKQVLETLKDVGSISLVGERRREIQLLLNADRLNAYGLTVDQVRNAVQKQNVEVPGGSFVSGPAEYGVRTMGRIRDVADFGRIVVAYHNGAAITFADIGRVDDTIQELHVAARLNGVSSLGMFIRKQSGTNTVDVADRVFAAIERLKTTLPADVKIYVVSDQSRFIRKSFEAIEEHLIFGGLLASVVVFLFIRNLRVTAIAALAIPTSIVGTFIVMRMLGFTLNNMTMLALSLATGIVIDDAIVVLENVFRFVEEKGVTPAAAAAEATAEIGLAVMATTLSLVVIFVPVAFMTGEVGRYFYSFGITSASAILISMFVSFTLTPALCAMWLRREDATSDHSTKGNRWYAAMDRRYGAMLEWSLTHRAVMLAMAGAVVASAVLLYPKVGKELVPDDDQGEFQITVRLPSGTSLARAEEFAAPIEQEIRALPNIDQLLALVNSSGASFNIVMTPLDERHMSQQELMRRARAMVQKYKGARISVSGSTSISGAAQRGGGPRNRGGSTSGNSLNILIQGPDIEQLQAHSLKLVDFVRAIPGVADADTDFEATQPELRIDVDRVRAADLGASIDTLASSLRTLVGGEEVSTFKDGDEQYMVVLRLDEPYRDAGAIGRLLIPAGDKTIQVSDVAHVRRDFAPAVINRYNRQRQISVNANLDGSRPLGAVLAAARARVEDLHLKPGYQAVFGGSARQLNEASSNFVIAILLAVAFIYMVLASQFNSFVLPLSIMTSLPLSLPAGLIALMALGMTLNVYSAIGLMMLFGIVKKNSILQVDYTNTLRAQGVSRHEAIVQANHVRLRPILMTTIAIVAGMLPIAFGRGAGAGSRASMAVTIIGGQALCLVLTLLVTPVVYSVFDDLRGWSPARVVRRAFGMARKKDEPALPVG